MIKENVSETKVWNNTQKRRIISRKEALKDLKDVLPLMFQSFNEGVQLYAERIIIFPIDCRDSLLETKILRSCVIENLKKNFPENVQIGKYKRVILRKNGYQILFKKLDSYNLPMSIVTGLSSSIYNQMKLPLFNNDFGITEPIIFLGYQKNKFGIIRNPKLVYIDDERMQWVIDGSDIQSINRTLLRVERPNIGNGKLVKAKDSVQKKKTS